jgi:hypothetical protein
MLRSLPKAGSKAKVFILLKKDKRSCKRSRGVLNRNVNGYFLDDNPSQGNQIA